MNLNDCYKILDINPDCSLIELKKAFRSKALKMHPDLNPLPDATNKFIQLNEAYEIILQHIKYKKKVESYINAQENYAYQHWFDHQQYNAKQRAQYYARRSYKEYKKSKVYKSAEVVYVIYYIFILAIGIMAIVSPLKFTTFSEIEPQAIPRVIAGLLFAITFGVLAIYFSIRSILNSFKKLNINLK